jgi:putative membrane protein
MTRAEGISLGALYAFTLFAALGYGIFALHPERLPDTDWARTFFQNAFAWNSRIHIVLTGLVLAVAFFRRAGVRWLTAFGSVFVLSFLAEHIGTGTGFPFSGYEYTGLLGPRIGERVPWVIPASWFFMSAPSWILARRTFPTKTVPRVLFATYLLVLWDVALDPAMSYLVTYWVWEVPGPYYTMPWVNFAGWALTGVVLMTTLEVLDRRIDWAGEVTLTWSLVFYVAIVLMPLGMLVAAGAWWAVALTLACGAVAVGVHLGLAETPSPLADRGLAVPSTERVAGEAA